MAIQISGTTVIDNSTNVNVGAAGSFHVTDSGAFVKNNAVGLGTTDTTGRDAGVGTSKGTLIYNETDLTVQVYDGTQWINGLTSPFVATGGTEDTTSRSGYKVHTFTSPGSFTVTSGAKTGEYIVVAAGGGGGSTFNGPGGGAGALRFSSTYTLSPGTYPVTVGAGGAGGLEAQAYDAGYDGNNSVFGPITSAGGGGGGGAAGPRSSPPSNPPGSGRDGGSGGGGHPRGGSGTPLAVGGTGTGDSGGTNGTASPANGWGNDGGLGNDSPYYGGGGGGASQTGQPQGNGGAGLTYTINGTPTAYAGGGGGFLYSTGGPRPSGGTGGGGPGGYGFDSVNTGQYAGTPGTANTGGGGGGSDRAQPGPYPGNYTRVAGGNGGSGVVIIAYPIA